jgi:hypothetical protein
MKNPIEINAEQIEQAFSGAADTLRVTQVNNVFAPLIESDVHLAEDSARDLLRFLELTNPDLDDATKKLLVKFGGAVGALSMRLLFEPFRSNEIQVEYREGSGLNQTDAVRRVTKPLADNAIDDALNNLQTADQSA